MNAMYTCNHTSLLMHAGRKKGIMAKRTTLDMSDADEIALRKVMLRYGQQNEAGALRLCVHMVAQAKEIVLESPVVDVRTKRGDVGG